MCEYNYYILTHAREMRLVVNENTARRQREYGSSTTRIRLVEIEEKTDRKDVETG